MSDPKIRSFTGKEILDAGYVHSPYVPMGKTPLFLGGEPPLPSAVDRLAAIEDPEAAKRVAEMDAVHEKWVADGSDDGFSLRKAIRTRLKPVLVMPDCFDQVTIESL